MRKVIVNFSGGKDSTVAILEALKVYPKEEIILCYQDTGADYLETKEHVIKIASMLELPLTILDSGKSYWDRLLKGWFPSHHKRWCTSELKVDRLRYFVRHEINADEIILVSGIRGDESLSRSKLVMSEKDSILYSERLNRHVYNWRPCLNYNAVQVKDIVKAEGLPLHPCYEFSSRCSCWCCFFQPNSVVRTYAEANQKLYEQACLLEDKIKHKWKDGFGFNDLMNQGRLL